MSIVLKMLISKEKWCELKPVEKIAAIAVAPYAMLAYAPLVLLVPFMLPGLVILAAIWAWKKATK